MTEFRKSLNLAASQLENHLDYALEEFGQKCVRLQDQSPWFLTKGDRVRRLADMLIAYFNREEALLDGDEVHNITSDIIESTFGLSLKVSTIDDCRNFNVSHLLARTTITDIKKWRGDNLLPNPSIKRMNVVKNIA